MKLSLNIKGKKYDIEISKENENIVKVKVNNKDFTFKDKKQEISIAKTSLPKRDFQKKEIKAPIAGEISEIFVKTGEFIKKDKKVLLLSAMKMENEIVSDCEGKIKKILITKNQKVNNGDILIILE